MSINNLACVVVLYNPSTAVIDNIATYIDKVKWLFLIDNSVERNDELLKNVIENKKVTYFHKGVNKGIAYGLNIGCHEAIKRGCEWILTMDQDSKFVDLDDRVILKHIVNSDNIAIFFPQYFINGKVYDKLFKNNGKSFITLTSGNFLNLQAYKRIGDFNEDLFIDFVDIDYCLRISSVGYSIKLMREITLIHGLGKVDYKTILGKKIVVTNHNYIRRYYITRNRFYIINEYKKQFPFYTRVEKKLFVNDLLKILLFESEKIKKICSMVTGYSHYKKGKYGNYNIKK